MAKREFDPNKYLASVHRVPEEQHAASLEEARRTASSLGPAQVWLRACETLVVGVLVGAAIGWLAGWSLVPTVVVTGVIVAVALLAGGLTLRALRSKPAK